MKFILQSFLLSVTCCYMITMVHTVEYQPSLNMAIQHENNKIVCRPSCSTKCEAAVRVLAATCVNMTKVEDDTVTVLKSGTFVVLCYIEYENLSSFVMLQKSFTATLSNKLSGNRVIDIYEVGNRKMKSFKSLKPEIQFQKFGFPGSLMTINCSITYPLREHQEMKLIRMNANRVKREIPLDAKNFSGYINKRESTVTIQYRHQFIYTREYKNNIFECRATDVFTQQYRTAVTDKLESDLCSSETLKITKSSEFHSDGHSSFGYTDHQLNCACTGSPPKLSYSWRNKSGELLIDEESIVVNRTDQAETYCCVARQNISGIEREWENCVTIGGDWNLNGDAWIIIERRFDGAVSFKRNWTEYKNGFGDLNGEFWLGNDKLHELTSAAPMKIQFNLWGEDDELKFAEYSSFSVASESDNYRLSISGHHLYSGIYLEYAGDAMFQFNNMQFSTKDRDNDNNPGISCSQIWGGYGGWWYNSGGMGNPHGEYPTPRTKNWFRNVMEWPYWQNIVRSLRKITIKIAYK